MKSQALKRVLVGRPMSSGELEHTLLPKVIALPVFSSDPLSSNAYATQEALIVLATAGAFGLILPISLAVAALLAIVVTSYRQTVHAYPTGGGAYRVSHENLGKYPGLIAASALLIDYVMTVSVSITAGVEAITSAVEFLHEHRVALAIAFIAFVTLMNLRGVKESGTFFAIPTYGFVISIYLLILTGFVKCVGGCPLAESATRDIRPEHAVTFLLVLRAFSAGTTALTGVEAIADGVPAFRYPQSRNAATTLTVMAALSISMFLGISWLADHTGVVYTEFPLGQRSVVAQIARAVFGGGVMFYVVQAMSAGILILAANTAYQDFPRLSSILAKDRYMPRQFINRGDRLVFSNGIVILAVLSALLIYVFDANLTALIQLYLVGVFISFTLSQTGMVLRTRHLRESGWKYRSLISGFGAAVTGVVLCVVIVTKFGFPKPGAWIVLVAIPIVIYMMHSINRHYTSVAEELAQPDRTPTDRRPGNQHLVLLVNRVDAAATRAIGYARSIRPSSIEAITFDASIHEVWKRVAPEIDLTTLEKGWSMRRATKTYLRQQRTQLSSNDFLTLVVPEVLGRPSLTEVVRHPSLHRLKASMLSEPGVQVMDVPVMQSEIDKGLDQAHEPARNYVVILVSGVTNATLQAIEYAETLRPTSITAASFGLDPEQTSKIGDEWLASGIQIPLEIEDSPFRDIGGSLRTYLDRFDCDGVNRVVTVVMPEFVVRKRRHSILHGQTALLVKRHILFEPGVVAVSVPYHLEQ
jgi:amino acid transporter